MPNKNTLVFLYTLAKLLVKTEGSKKAKAEVQHHKAALQEILKGYFKAEKKDANI